MKLFLDTNVLVDYFAGREPYRPGFVKLQAMQIFGDAELWASAKSFSDVSVLCKRHVPNLALQGAFIESSKFMNICSVSADDILEASRRKWDDFDTCLIAVSAEKVKADYLLTRDEVGFAKSKVEPITLSNLLNALERKGYSYEEISL